MLQRDQSEEGADACQPNQSAERKYIILRESILPERLEKAELSKIWKVSKRGPSKIRK